MSKVEYDKINSYLTGIFNRVLVIEERNLKASRFSDITIKEMHTLDAIGEAKIAIASNIAKELMVTISTVTISLKNLERKNYIIRERSSEDRRIVYIKLTDKGDTLYRAHRKFHKQMVKRFVKGISEKDMSVLFLGLKNLYNFLEEQKLP
ncbi:MAG: MarR family winged helix-turn-helix transcriptional regulator [Lactovum sp.]